MPISLAPVATYEAPFLMSVPAVCKSFTVVLTEDCTLFETATVALTSAFITGFFDTSLTAVCVDDTILFLTAPSAEIIGFVDCLGGDEAQLGGF